MLAVVFKIFYAFFICSWYFIAIIVLPGFKKFQCIRSAADHQTITMTFFWCNFWFGKVLEIYQYLTTEMSYNWCCKLIPFSSQVTIFCKNGSFLLRKLREYNTLKQCFLCLSLNLYRTHFSSFFVFPIFSSI